MKRTIYIWLTLFPFLFTLFLSGCRDDGTFNVAEEEREETIVKFAIGVGNISGSRTKSEDVNIENEVSEVDILVFNPSGAGGKFVQRSYGRDIKDLSGLYVRKEFTATLPVGTFDLILIANGRTIINQHYPEGIPYTAGFDDIQQKLILSVEGKWNVLHGSDGYIDIPMWGVKRSVEINTNTSLIDQNSFKLARGVAKIDVVIPEKIQNDFQLKSVSLYNRSAKGTLMPEISNWSMTENIVTTISLPVTHQLIKGPVSYTQTAQEVKDTGCTDRIYTFEAPAGKRDEFPDYTCLVVGGIYGGDNQLYYYRIDFARTGEQGTEYLELKRNHCYYIAITKVGGPGSDSNEDAYNSLSLNIEAEILEWNDISLGDIVWDGQYYLSIRNRRIFLGGQPDAVVSVPMKTNVVPGNVELSFVSEQNGTTQVIDGGIQNTRFRVKLVKDESGEFTALQISALQGYNSNNVATNKQEVLLKAANLRMNIHITQVEEGDPDWNWGGDWETVL